MDYRKLLQDLYAQRDQRDRVIAGLEDLQRGSNGIPSALIVWERRGQTFMSPKEREEDIGVPGGLILLWSSLTTRTSRKVVTNRAGVAPSVRLRYTSAMILQVMIRPC